MENMLQFNPDSRITAKEALASPYFDSIRDIEKEQEAVIPLSFEFDEIEDISMDSVRQYFISAMTSTGN
jgi:serine/threonine protein kinase